MLSIRKCAKDGSAYVRKTAAHAIPKLYSIDAGQEKALTSVIMDLVRDPSVLVTGSAVHAFEEVCPSRIDLVHGVYRKLCVVLAEMDEWGQVTIVNLLARYARSQFVDPGRCGSGTVKSKESGFYDGGGRSSSSSGSDDEWRDPVADHRLLLNATLPLLQSRNSAVVIAVASLHFYLAPGDELQRTGVAKAMVRCSRVGREHAYLVLANIRSVAATRPELFRAHLKDFYVVASDAQPVASIKLHIISYIANHKNIKAILAEFRQYVQSGKSWLMTYTTQAVGRCAVQLGDVEVTQRCLRGLVAFLSSPRPEIAAESVLVLRKLLVVQQQQQKSWSGSTAGATVPMKRAVRAAVRLLDADKPDVATWSAARACVVWIIGEFAALVPNVAPDVLRKLAKSFTAENDEVKLQALTLASKLCARGEEERCSRIATYVIDLAACDANCDVRDRARTLRILCTDTTAALDPSISESQPLLTPRHLVAQALASKPAKPAPSVSLTAGEPSFTLGSLSHVVHHRVAGYVPLPDFAGQSSDPSIRKPDKAFADFSTEFADTKSAPAQQHRVAPEVAASVHTSLDQFYEQDDDSSSDSYSDSDSDSESFSDGSFSSDGKSSNSSTSSNSSGSSFYSSSDNEGTPVGGTEAQQGTAV